MSSKPEARASIATAFLMAFNFYFLSENVSANGVKFLSNQLTVQEFSGEMLKNGKWFNAPPVEDFTPRLRKARETGLYSKRCEPCVKSFGPRTEQYHFFEKKKDLPYELSFLPRKIFMQWKVEWATIAFEYAVKDESKKDFYLSSFSPNDDVYLAAEIQKWTEVKDEDEEPNEEFKANIDSRDDSKESNDDESDLSELSDFSEEEAMQ
eukprot:GHVP01019811.1.p1 GENE.GHVP01019811.1~~GHVP01019811.1.p1  ORF type:complete len:219 (+),score=51.20 GHVP01019811.1:34-657(+)